MLPHPGISTIFTWIVVTQIISIEHHHSHFLATTLDFATFFSNGTFCMVLHLFLQLGCFWVYITSFRKLACFITRFRILDGVYEEHWVAELSWEYSLTVYKVILLYSN